MRIITETRIKQAMLDYPQWSLGLKLWSEVFRQKALTFESFFQIKEVWKNASGWNVDRVGGKNAIADTFGGDFDLYIFDIHGTNCRIVTRINATHHRIFVRFVGSHAEYDKWCKTRIK